MGPGVPIPGSNGGGITINDYEGTTGNGGQRIEKHHHNDTEDGVIKSWPDFDQTWHFSGDPSTDTAVADSIAINYSMSGISFRFVWRMTGDS
ncbi:MAG: hypothetical protein R3231_00180 [bacterium]|nr:hypothetical protein [bacterium]